MSLWHHYLIIFVSLTTLAFLFQFFYDSFSRKKKRRVEVEVSHLVEPGNIGGKSEPEDLHLRRMLNEIREKELQSKGREVARTQSNPALNQLDNMLRDPLIDTTVDEQIRKLKQGYLHFDCPAEMAIGALQRVVVEIFKDEKILSTILQKEAVSNIRVGRKMKAKLMGNDFEITTLNSDTQVILMDQKTVWNWDVRPVASGDKNLLLVVTVSLNVGNLEEAYDYPIYSKKITVKVNRLYTLKKFWLKNWDKILGILFGSGIVLVILKICGVIKG